MAEKTGPVAGHTTAALRHANRTQFAAATPSFGAARDYVLQLERLLAQTSAERNQLQAHLDAVHASTSWRVTRPVRWAAAMLQSKQDAPAAPVEHVEPLPRPIPTYDDWIAGAEAEVVARLLGAASPGGPAAAPTIGLVCIGSDAPPEADDTISVLVLSHDTPPADILAASLAQMDVHLVCFLDAHTQLSKDALALVAETAMREPDLDIIFGDEDWLDANGRRTRPFFKPGWNAAMQQASDLLGPCTFVRTSLLAAVAVEAGPAWRYDLANQVVEATRPERIGHIPAILCHRRAGLPGYDEALRQAAQLQLQRNGVRAQVVRGDHAWDRVVYAVTEPPLVSVIIPTLDHPELLQACTHGLLRETDYPRLELLIVDNGTTDPEALALLDRLAADERVTVLRDASPFNWAALNNRAAAQAAGDVLLLLNNDIAVLQPGWLTELVGQTIQPGVGAVGAKLLYPDGRGAACRDDHRRPGLPPPHLPICRGR